MTMRMSVPIEQRHGSRTTGQAIHSWFRLFRIEMKRSPAIWAALLIAGITTFMMWDSLLVGVVRWRELNDSAVEVPPIYASVVIGAFAAWRAGTIQQRGLVDQVVITTFPGALHDLAGVLSVAIWGMAGYLVPVAGFYVYGSLNATWGGPDLTRPFIAIATVLAASTLGWLVGTLIRHRIAPLAAVVLLLGLFLGDVLTRNMRMTTVLTGQDSWRTQINDGWWHHLVPNNVLTATYAGEIGLRVLSWLVSLAAVFWLVGVFVRHRSQAATIAFGMVAMLATGCAAGVVALEPDVRYASNQAAVADLRCTTRIDDQITVCVHPENETLLDATADAVEPIAMALKGVPGAPHNFINGLGSDAYSRGAVPLMLNDLSTIRSGQLQRALVADIVMHNNRPPEELVVTSPQYVVSAWLLSGAGQDIHAETQSGYLPPMWALYPDEQAVKKGMTPAEYFRHQEETYRQAGVYGRDDEAIAQFETDVDAALQRFLIMPDDQRTAWLSTNWDALIAGELTLDDLP